MDKRTTDNITANALAIAEYASIAEELRGIAKFIVEPKHKKKLQSIAKFLESEAPERLFNSGIYKTLLVYRYMGNDDFAGDEAIAAKVGESPQSTKQRINALKAGGIQIQESIAKGYKINPTGGRPAKGRSVDP